MSCLMVRLHDLNMQFSIGRILKRKICTKRLTYPPMMILTGKRVPIERKRYPGVRKRDGFHITTLCARKNTAAADFR